MERTMIRHTAERNNRWRTCGILLCLMLAWLSNPTPARAADDYETTTPTKWWVKYDQTEQDVDDTVRRLNARVTNIKMDPATGTATVVYVENTGEYAKNGWWYVDIDERTLEREVARKNGRLISLQAYENSRGQIRMAAAMVENTGADAKTSWYLPNAPITGITEFASANNARPITLQSYTLRGETRYSSILISNASQNGYWLFWGATIDDINAKAAEGYRLIDLTNAGGTTAFNAVLDYCADNCPGSSRWFNVNRNEVLDKAQNEGMRPIAVDKYYGNCDGSSACFVAAYINNAATDKLSCDEYGCISQRYFRDVLGDYLDNQVAGYTVMIGDVVQRSGGLAQSSTDTTLPMSPDLVTNIASVTKTMTAIAITQLLTYNQLSVDTRIAPFLYRDWVRGPNVDQITFRQLLTHTSGFGQAYADCMVNGNGASSGTGYDGVKAMVSAGVPDASVIGVPEYGNCNFALLRELMPALMGFTGRKVPSENNNRRRDWSAGLYLNYMNANVFQPVDVPPTTCVPPSGTNKILSYDFPITTDGTDWGDWSLRCGGGGLVMSANQMFRVIRDLADGNVLLNPGERRLMTSESLGWDNAVGHDCTETGVCKNGKLSYDTGETLFTYVGIVKCDVPVVLVVNSPLPPDSSGITSLVRDAVAASRTLIGVPAPCPQP